MVNTILPPIWFRHTLLPQAHSIYSNSSTQTVSPSYPHLYIIMLKAMIYSLLISTTNLYIVIMGIVTQFTSVILMVMAFVEVVVILIWIFISYVIFSNRFSLLMIEDTIVATIRIILIEVNSIFRSLLMFVCGVMVF